MFTLPNNIKIDEDRIIKGFNSKDKSYRYYLDIITGQVGSVKSEKDSLIDNSRYFEIPRISDQVRKKWVSEYIKEIVYPEDKFLAGLFTKALKEPIDYFFKLAEKTDDIHGWAQWEYDNLY